MTTDIAILTNLYLNPENPTQTGIGGVETWIGEFAKLLISMGYDPVIFQSSVKQFKLKYKDVLVIGTGEMDSHKASKVSHKEIEKRHIERIVYATSFVGESDFVPGQIFIQHGIHWDYTDKRPNFFKRLKWERIRRKLSRHDLEMYRKSMLTIAVDTSFINYARISLGHHFDENKISYIPNFAIAQEKTKWMDKWEQSEQINIVFARRFVSRRGVHPFANAVEDLLSSHPQMNVLIAGTGPAENHLRHKFRNTEQVVIREIPHEEMAKHLNRMHIAVIPSTYSEGTSLSCLEAMASGCAVIASNIGGLGNIVLPDFNGLLIKPTSMEIKQAITHLFNDMKKAKDLALNGHDTIRQAFSLAYWRKRLYKALIDAGVKDLSKNRIEF